MKYEPNSIRHLQLALDHFQAKIEIAEDHGRRPPPQSQAIVKVLRPHLKLVRWLHGLTLNPKASPEIVASAQKLLSEPYNVLHPKAKLNHCLRCGAPKRTSSLNCDACHAEVGDPTDDDNPLIQRERAALTVPRCQDCGTRIDADSKRCWDCHAQTLRGVPLDYTKRKRQNTTRDQRPYNYIRTDPGGSDD